MNGRTGWLRTDVHAWRAPLFAALLMLCSVASLAQDYAAGWGPGVGQVVPVEDCLDGSDEAQCDCQDDEFQCSDFSECIPARRRCDRTQDCEDNSDEEDCEDCFEGATCGDGSCVPESVSVRFSTWISLPRPA